MADTYTNYPQSARNNAKKVLKWKKEHGSEVKAMTPTGWRRATQLANGDAISYDTVKRIAAFERHRENSKIDPKYKSTPWKDNGWVSWLGWGGSAGIAWAKKIVASKEKKSKNEAMVRSIVRGIIREEIQLTEGRGKMLVYHRSEYNFSKFSITNASTRESRMDSGYGLYFRTFDSGREYGQWLYEVELFSNKKNYTLLELGRTKVDDNILKRIAESLERESYDSSELYEFAYSGYLFYRTLGRILGGGDVSASLFLLKNGVDGLAAPHGGRGNDYDYVIFDDKHIKIKKVHHRPDKYSRY